MGRNVLAIAAIFFATALAWMILGSSINARTKDSGTDLGPRVASTWGAPQQEKPPLAYNERIVQKEVVVVSPRHARSARATVQSARRSC